jgi:hypothetical protein
MVRRCISLRTRPGRSHTQRACQRPSVLSGNSREALPATGSLTFLETNPMPRPVGAVNYVAVLRIPGAPRAFTAATLARLSMAPSCYPYC